MLAWTARRTATAAAVGCGLSAAATVGVSVSARSAIARSACSAASSVVEFRRHSHIRLAPSLDLRTLSDQVDAVQANLVARGSGGFADAHLVKSLYKESIEREFAVSQVRKERNAIGKQFSAAKTKEEKDAVNAKGAALKTRLSTMEEDLTTLKAKLESAALRIPNATSPQTPIGPEGTGRVIQEVGERRGVALDHVNFCTRWGLLDLQSGSMVSGSRFYYLQHELALLELALVQYAMQKLVRKGWTPVLPPDLVKSQFVSACGFQPRDAEGTNSQVYHVADSELALVGTAEIPLASMYYDREVSLTKPIKHVAFGHAFRTEAGGQGLAIRGLYRVHQFSKVELFALAAVEQSEALFDEIIAIQQEMYSELGLAYRVLEIPSEDLGAPAYRKIDCEAWMPGRGVDGSWGEISSTSNCTDYQSRRLGIRYLDAASKEKRFAHTLNGTAAAIPRLLIAIIEQHQSADGRSVTIPEALRPFIMGTTSIPDHTLFPDRKEVVPTPEKPAATTKPAKKH